MPDASELTIPPEKVCYIISKAREFDAKDPVTDPNEGSNPTDDDQRAVLEDHPDDPVRTELVTFINDLNVDEQVDLVAMMWLGRGDDEFEDWSAIRAEAERARNNRTAAYLIGTPLLADYLEEALNQFDESCEDYEF